MSVPGPTPEKARLGPPPRWLRCPRKGALIAGKFVPFKTPLCELYNDQVPEMYRFLPSMLISSLQSQKVKVGLWVDLTFTDRFYSKDDVDHFGCRYVKMNLRGHGEFPSEQQTEAFITLCKDFIRLNPTEIIAVHCTHGFNRTGFLICAYLVSEMDWSIEAAVREFAMARPPGVYKEDYLRELFNRFGDVEDAPQAPPLPDWCDESEPVLDDNEAESGSIARTSRPPGKLPEFEPPIAGVAALPNPGECRRLQKKCQQLCHWEKKGFPGSQPVSMDQENVHFLREKEYMVSWKADGTRYLMLIEGEGGVYMFDRDHNVFKVENLRFPHRKETTEQPMHVRDVLIDGELVMDRVADNGGQRPRFLIYDAIHFQGQEVGKCPLRRRFECVDQELIRPRDKAHKEGRRDPTKEPFSVRLKLFKGLPHGLHEFLSPEFEKNLPHEIDGLIFQPANDPYECGRCHSILKWKPAHLNSVDFKLAIVKEQREGMLPEWVGYLYVLGLDLPFGKIKVTKTLRELDKRIIECKFNQNQWVFMRERKDKSFPNAYQTAAGVCKSIAHPVTKEMILEMCQKKTAGKTPASGPAPAPPNPNSVRSNGHVQPPETAVLSPPAAKRLKTASEDQPTLGGTV